MTPEDLRRRADLLESKLCTGLGASWCPVHGDCVCDRNDDGEAIDGLDDPRCPLHGFGSSHAAAGEGAIP